MMICSTQSLTKKSINLKLNVNARSPGELHTKILNGIPSNPGEHLAFIFSIIADKSTALIFSNVKFSKGLTKKFVLNNSSKRWSVNSIHS